MIIFLKDTKENKVLGEIFKCEKLDKTIILTQMTDEEI